MLVEMKSVFRRRLTVHFDPHEPRSPHSVLVDQELYPCLLENPFQERGISYHFPYCSEIRLVAQFAPEELREFRYNDAEHLALQLVQLVPHTVGRVVLEADIAEVSARFVVELMKRSGDPAFGVVVEVRTGRDEVVQSVEVSSFMSITQRALKRLDEPSVQSTRMFLDGSTQCLCPRISYYAGQAMVRISFGTRIQRRLD
jgi:hypothetical protein